jgi:preprotein translocase subunit YajC
MTAFLFFCVALGVWVFMVTRRCRKRSASDEYIAELRKARGLRGANRGRG